MGIRLFYVFTCSILAGIGLFHSLDTAIQGFGIYQTLASIILAAALTLFYGIGYSDGKQTKLMDAKPTDIPPIKPQQRRDPQM